MADPIGRKALMMKFDIFSVYSTTHSFQVLLSYKISDRRHKQNMTFFQIHNTYICKMIDFFFKIKYKSLFFALLQKKEMQIIL